MIGTSWTVGPDWHEGHRVVVTGLSPSRVMTYDARCSCGRRMRLGRSEIEVALADGAHRATVGDFLGGTVVMA